VIFETTELPGVWVVTPELHHDERGFFTRLSVPEEIAPHVPIWGPTYTCTSYNKDPLTLRGMHWQTMLAPEAKLVRCIKGSIYDVAVDVDPASPTFRRWTARTLSAENRQALLLPPLTAHGFLTLEAESEVLYEISGGYSKPNARGFLWSDKEVGIDWPASVRTISYVDQNLPILYEVKSVGDRL
jgi:dTDP-4-dehydrorhamnose 3,5-epimerase